VALAGLAACQALPDYPNRPLAAGAANQNPAPLGDAADPQHPIVLIAFSGGGSRATALGLGVLDELRGATYPWRGRSERMVDRIAVVSSVSGGSVIGAWFGLVGPDRVDEIRPKFLEQDNMASLVHQAADPITLSRLAFGSYTRIDVQRDLFDRELFSGQKFADLQHRPGAPFVILNATDLTSGEVFAFTPQRFDDICSDLAALPLSVAVATSADVPIALSPMSLHDYAYDSCPVLPPAEWVTDTLTLKAPRYINIEAYKRARYANALRDGPAGIPFRNEHYLHLVDGGLADNQGIHSLSEALVAPQSPLRLARAINVGSARRIVVIAVNARADVDSNIGGNPAVPGLLDVLDAVVSIPMEATTAYANASLQELVAELQSAGAKPVDPSGRQLFSGLHVYSVPIDFDQFLPDQQALQQRVKAIGTSWNLTGQNIDDAIQAGRLLLRQHPCFQRLLLDLGSAVPPADALTARQICHFEDDQPG
jgi:NTE family protein